jgi:flagellar M-ring protein FliF
MGSTDAQSYKKSDTTENFAYNESQKQSEKSLGEVIAEKTTAAITLQYGSRVPDDTKLTDEMIDQVKELVSGATGIPAANVAVTKMKIQPPSEVVPTLSETIQSLIADYGLLALLFLMLIALVIIALPRKSKQVAMEPAFAGAEEIAASKYNLNDIKTEPVPEIDIEERSEVKKQIEKFVQQKPDAVAQLLRNWLTDDYE